MNLGVANRTVLSICQIERKDELCQVVAQFVSFIFLFLFSDSGGHTQPKLLNSHDHLGYTLS